MIGITRYCWKCKKVIFRAHSPMDPSPQAYIKTSQPTDDLTIKECGHCGAFLESIKKTKHGTMRIEITFTT